MLLKYFTFYWKPFGNGLSLCGSTVQSDIAAKFLERGCPFRLLMAAYTCAVIERVSSVETPIRSSHEAERSSRVVAAEVGCRLPQFVKIRRCNEACRRRTGGISLVGATVREERRRGGGVTAVNRWSRYILINNRRCFPLQLGSTAARTSADFPSSCFTPCAYYTCVRPSVLDSTPWNCD